MQKNYMKWLRNRVGADLVFSPSVAAVIHDSSGRLLLQEKTSGEAWSLPAGGIELGETPQQAIVREVLEETGYSVVITRILGVFGGTPFRYQYPNGDRVEYVVTLFACQIVGDVGNPTDAETKSLQFFCRHNMPRLALPYPCELLFGGDRDPNDQRAG